MKSSYYRTEELSFFEVVLPMAVLAVSLIPPPREDVKVRALVPYVSGKEVMPSTPEDAELLLYVDLESQKDTEFRKLARRQLVGKDYFSYVLENATLKLEVGERHNTFKRWVASAISLLAIHPGVTAAHVYALFMRQAENIPLDDDDPRRELWRLVENIWGHQQEQMAQEAVERAAVKAQEEAVSLEMSDEMLLGVEGWPGVKLPAEKWEWVQNRMIACTADTGHHFVIKRSGYYAEVGVKKSQLIAQVRALGVHKVLPVVRPRYDKSGEQVGERFATYEEISADHVVVVRTVEARPQIPGAFLEDTDGPNPKLVLPSFRRNPKIEPCFSPEVDVWVRALAGYTKSGRSLYETLCRHIGLFLAFERGAVCAMSFRIDPGAGKKLLAHGFMECLEYPELAHSRDLVDRNSPGLLKSPFVAVNEGWETSIMFAHVSDTTRKLITGDSYVVNQKYMPEITVRFPYRVLLTANDDGLVLGLAAGKDLAPAAREALAVRIQHYEPGDAPVKLLKEKGEWEWTKGWIKGDGGEASQFTVARHFMWLFERHGRNANPTDRHGLLMAGDPECSPVDIMRTQGGSTPAVVETLIKRLNNRTGIKGKDWDGREGVLTCGDRLYVMPGPLLDYWRKFLSEAAHERLTSKKIALSLRGLIRAGGPDGERSVTVNNVRGRWIELDVPILLQEAEKLGWACIMLEDLLARSPAHANGNGNGNGHGLLVGGTT